MNELAFVPVDFAEIESGRVDLPQFIPDPVRDKGCLRIVEDRAWLVVEPARPGVNLCKDRIEAEGADAVLERAGGRIENLPLPGEILDKRSYFGAERGARRNDCRAVALALRDGPGWRRRKERIKVLAAHLQQFGNIV